ncbi:MAG: hypothetical protein GY756_15870 [bacterium]|nr:hypothetical protein [bacterium]
MKILFISIIMIVFYQGIFAQYDHYTTIKTPKNASNEAIDCYEYSTYPVKKSG